MNEIYTTYVEIKAFIYSRPQRLQMLLFHLPNDYTS